MITSRGQAKVMDFGLARVIAGAVESEVETQSLLTTPGTIVGTMPYMSPEQVRGEVLDGRSDIFSFGVVLYEILSGRQPFASESAAATISAILNEEPPTLLRYVPGLPEELQRIARKCLEKDRERRSQTMRDVATDLDNCRREHETAQATLSQRDQEAGGEAVIVPASDLKRRKFLSSRRTLIGGAALVMVIGVALAYMLAFRKANTPALPSEIKSLAVLPLQNLSHDPEQDYFADGMTEALTAELSKISALKVISRTSAMQYKGAKKPLPEIARELGVDGLIEGSVLREGDQVRITVQLIHGPSDKHVWADSYQRELRGILALQSEVARAIAGQIRVTLTPKEQARLAGAGPVDPEVHDLFLRGLFYRRKQPWGLFWTKSREYFEQAIAKDPSYAPAHAELGSLYAWVALVGPLTPQEAWPKAEAAAHRALELDDDLAEAHRVLGRIRLVRDWNWQEAEREYQRALALNPNSPDVHSGYAAYLAMKGKPDESVSEAKRALELDPLRVDLSDRLGLLLLHARRYDKAIEQGRRSLELDPNSASAHGFLAGAYELKGMEKEAAEETIKVLTAMGETALSSQFKQIYNARGYWAARRVLDQHTVEDELKKLRPNSWTFAYTYARLGEKDKAFEWLEKAYEERNGSMLQLRSDPDVDSLRDDPRFQALLRRMNFPQ
jgi:adenylate cyclase